MPFDRLIQTVDSWAATQPDVRCFAQIGESEFVPRHMEWACLLDPATYRNRLADAELVVSHAGMGTIITAAEYSKPLILMPRRGNLRETRNDHQVATAKWLAQLPGVRVASDAEELLAALNQRASLPSPLIKRTDSPDLVEALRKFIAGMS